MYTRIVKHIVIGIILLFNLSAYAQLYPLRSSFVINPPYPLNLETYGQADYLGMQLNIDLTDNSKINYQVGLKLVVEGQSGVRIETSPTKIWEHLVILNPGNNPIDISVLQSLFNIESVISTGLDYSGELPEGMYRFKVEAYDIEREVLVSDPNLGVHIAWLSRFEPPILTFPSKNYVIGTPIDGAASTAMFSWVPRGVYPGLTDVEYTLEIVEVYDDAIAPEELFNGGSADLISHSITTSLTSNSILFPTEFVGMQPDKWYAWRVRANDLSGNVFYRNSGYSEVRTFFYGTPCEEPSGLTVEKLNENSVQISWDDYSATTNYVLEFRNKSNWGIWTSIPTPTSGMEAINLEPGADYEFRLAIDCGNISSNFIYSEYTTPISSNTDCRPPSELSAYIDDALIGKEKLRVDWKRMPGAIEYQVDVRSMARTLSQQTTNLGHSFRWGEKGISGDTIWVRTASQCWEDSAYVFGEEHQIILKNGGGSVGCSAPETLIDSAVTYPTGITEVFWPLNKVFNSYTLLWRPTGMSAPFQAVTTLMPPATIQGLQDGDSVECLIVYHCSLGSDTSDVAGIRTKRASGDKIGNTGSCYEPSYLRGFVPTHTSMQLVWEAEPGTTVYEINWKKSGEYIWNTTQVNDKEAIIENLEENATYLFRVRTICGGAGFSRWTAIDSVNLANLSSVNDNCPVPYYDEIDVNSSREASINFTNDPTYTTYGSEYRLQTKLDWSEAETRGNTVIFSNLKGETTYEVRVRGFCGANRSEYTLIDTFTTPEALVENVLECGLDSENSSISNKEPIPALIPGDKFTANGWVLYIKNVVETGGVYNGAAYAKIPYLQHSMVEFTLEKAKINTDSVMFSGRAILKGLNVQLINPEIVERIEYLLNVAELGIEQAQEVVAELQAIVDMIPDLGGGAHGSDTSGFPDMNSKQLFAQGIDDLTAAKDTLLDGLKNVIVARDLAQSGVDALARAVEKALAGLLLGQELAPLDSCVVFIANPEGDHGFDEYRYTGSEMQYDVRRTFDDQEYYVAHKAILPNVENKVKVVLPESTISEYLEFATDAGEIIDYANLDETDENGNAVIELTLNSSISQILAHDSISFKGGQNSDTTFWMCVGELAVNNYEAKTRTVVLVPLNGASKVGSTDISTFVAEMTTTLSDIYAPSNMGITVQMGDKLIVNELTEGVDDSDNNILTRFTKDMNLVIDAFEAANDPADDTYYMFLVNESDTTTKEGYMPFQQRYGFITVGKDVSKEDFIHTTAHELGHGAFNLRHPFSDRAKYPLTENSTDNLMDYGGGTNLFAYQWGLVDDPGFMFKWFMSEDEAALMLNLINENFAALFDNVYQNYDSYLTKIEQVKTEKDSFRIVFNQLDSELDTNFMKQWGVRTDIMTQDFIEQRFRKIRYAKHLSTIGKITLRSKHIYLGDYEMDVPANIEIPYAPTTEKRTFSIALYNNSDNLEIKKLKKLRVSNILELIDKDNISYIYCDETFLLKGYLIIAFYEKNRNEPTLIIQVNKAADDALFEIRQVWLDMLNITFIPNGEIFADWTYYKDGISIQNTIQDSINYLEFVNGCITSGYFNSDSASQQPMRWMKSNGLLTNSASFAGKKVNRIINEFAEVIRKADSIFEAEHKTLYDSLVTINKYSISYSGTQHLRLIAGTSSPSNHSLGAAVDFRVKYNPMYRVGHQPYEIALIEHVTGFRVNQSDKSNSIVRDKSLEFLKAVHGKNYPLAMHSQTDIVDDYRGIEENRVNIALLSGIGDSAIVIQDFIAQRTGIVDALTSHKSRVVFDEASITGIDSLVAHLNQVTGDTIPIMTDANISAFFTERTRLINAIGKDNTINSFITYFYNQAISNDPNRNKLFEDGFGDIEPEVYEAFNKAHKLVCKRIMGKELSIEWGGKFNSKIDAMHFGLATEFVKYLTNQPIKE